jgi:SAM-dependent methyltransferase
LNVFDKMGVYWAEIADQNQTQRQVQFIINTVKPREMVLDLACGTGRHMIPFSKEGYDIVGLDISRKLLKIAKTRLCGIQLVRADMRRLPFKPGAFVAAISMDTSFGYLPTEEEDIQSLMELHETLKQEGKVIVDVFNRERLMKKYAAKHTANSKHRKYPGFFLTQKRTVDRNDEKLRDLWLICDKADGKTRSFRHVARLYKLEGLRDLLEKAGFAVKQVYGDYEGQQFSPDSNRLIFVANAK